jgi:hypothetical protein
MRSGRRGARDLSYMMMIREMSDECGSVEVEKDVESVNRNHYIGQEVPVGIGTAQ